MKKNQKILYGKGGVNMKKYFLDMVITISNTDVLESDPDKDCIVYEIDPQKPEELKSINDRIERWNGYSFNHGHVTVTTRIYEISAEEAKNYTIMKAADYFPELAQN